MIKAACLLVERKLGSVHLKSVGGGPENRGGGMQIPILDLEGGQVNSALDLGGSFKFRMRGKKPVMLNIRIIIYLLNNQINYFIYSIRYFFVSVQYSTGTPFQVLRRGGDEGRGC